MPLYSLGNTSGDLISGGGAGEWSDFLSNGIGISSGQTVYSNITSDLYEEPEPDDGTDWLEIARGNVNDGNFDAAQFILEVEMGLDRELALSLMNELRLEVDGEETMAMKIRRYQRGESVEGIDDDVVKKYFDEEKKKRYLTQDERRGLHKPIDDGEKCTSSVSLDDLVPS